MAGQTGLRSGSLRVRGHEKVPGFGQLKSPVVATSGDFKLATGTPTPI
jgi:hypothetical protein